VGHLEYGVGTDYTKQNPAGESIGLKITSKEYLEGGDDQRKPAIGRQENICCLFLDPLGIQPADNQNIPPL